MAASTVSQRRRFGTFAGVFTPCVLTILGVIMYLRTGYVVGTAGLTQALAIILLANVITLLTALSLAAIATNTEVAAGGDYFLVSRSLGPEFGGAIGLALYLALAVSVALYVIGFTEAMVSAFPALGWTPREIAVATTVAVFVVAFVGADWATRAQFAILALLGISILSFLAGAISAFSGTFFADVIRPAYGPGEDFWSAFAIYFPAVTGVTAGAAMSGELRDPGKSLPVGTLAAVGVTTAIYVVLAFVVAGTAPRDELRADSLVMVRYALVPGLVTAGILAATLSSALTSFVTAPRILQAVARDRVIPGLRPFGVGSGATGEPRRATVLTLVVALAGALVGQLNVIAPVITMFFLITYGSLNAATFFEGFSRTPSFRPRFRQYHWSFSLAGVLSILFVMLLLSPLYAGVAVLAVGGVFTVLARRQLVVRWGDAWGGFLFSRARYYLVQLEREKLHPKNWRLELLVLSPNPRATEPMIAFADWLESDRGVLQVGQIIEGEVTERNLQTREACESSMRRLLAARDIPGFPLAVVSPDFSSGVISLLQTAGIGAFRPNTVLMGWAENPENHAAFLRTWRAIIALGRNLLIWASQGSTPIGNGRTIDVWWRGKENGALMLLLAHLVVSSSDWRGTRIRLLRAVGEASAVDKAREGLQQLLDRARIDAVAEVVLEGESIRETIAVHSAQANLTILGFALPEPGSPEESAFFEKFDPLVQSLPMVLLVNSVADVKLWD